MPYKNPEDKKAWAKNNRERVLESKRKFYQNNKEKIKQENKEYRETGKGQKVHTIANWKHRGVIHDDWDALYEAYLQATHCAFCKNEFKDTRDRCLDHCHQTGLFRAFLCQSCNVCDVLKHQT